MASKDLTFKLFGRDVNASSTMRTVGNSAKTAGQSFASAGRVIGVAMLAASTAIVAFGLDSVKVFADAQTQQNKLNFAYEKFPALADASLQSLRDLNTELAKTTKYDDDATAAAEGVLAQFGLTGKQLTKLVPLLQDYASAVGKDLPDAATDLGKALLGQGRALKAVGIEFSDTGTLAGNFDELMGKLTDTVGGFATKEGQTAAGQLAILQNRFGEFQETIGEALLPALVKLMDEFESDVMPGLEKFANWFSTDGVTAIAGFIGWWTDWSTAVVPAAILGLSALTAGMIALDVAMDANPIGAIVAGIILAIGFWTTFANNLQNDINLISDNWAFFGNAIANAANFGILALNNLLSPLNAIIGAINFITGTNFSGLSFGSPTFNQYVPAASAAGGRTGGNSGVRYGHATPFADGGIVRATPGGVFANIGEGGNDEAVVPLTRQNLSAMGGGDTYHFTFPGAMIGNEDFIAKTVTRAVKNAKGRGFNTGTAFA